MSLNRRGRLQFILYRRSRKQVLCLWIGEEGCNLNYTGGVGSKYYVSEKER